MTTNPWVLIAIGAGLVLVLAVLVTLSVMLIVHAHEVRELRVDGERHAETRRDLDDFRRLVMAAINGRVVLEQDVGNLKVQVRDLDSRVRDLEAA